MVAHCPQLPSVGIPVAPELDKLDHIIQEASQLFLNSYSWKEFVPRVSDARGDFHPSVGKVHHPSAHLLNQFRIRGAPMVCRSTPWTFVQKATALTHGPHQSARQHTHFLHQNFVNMLRNGQSTLCPARLVLNELQLCLSSLGVVPQ
jgi:hypothetical protein